MIYRATPHRSTTLSKPFWKIVMDKLKHFANNVPHQAEPERPNITTLYTKETIDQATFNSSVLALCVTYDIPVSLVTALMINNVANTINNAENKPTNYSTLKELTECLVNGDGNWMQFIPNYKIASTIHLDRLDIGLTRAFYGFAISQGLDPIDAFNVTKAREKDIQTFLKHASNKAHGLANIASTIWYDYHDLVVYASRTVLGNPVNPDDFNIHYTERKGISLS